MKTTRLDHLHINMNNTLREKNVKKMINKQNCYLLNACFSVKTCDLRLDLKSFYRLCFLFQLTKHLLVGDNGDSEMVPEGKTFNSGILYRFI